MASLPPLLSTVGVITLFPSLNINNYTCGLLTLAGEGARGGEADDPGTLSDTFEHTSQKHTTGAIGRL